VSIAELRNEVERAKKALEYAQQQLQQAQEDALGVHIGDVVRSTGKKINNEYRVARIDFGWRDRPWLYGHRRKKDGTWEVKRSCLYDDWEKL